MSRSQLQMLGERRLMSYASRGNLYESGTFESLYERACANLEATYKQVSPGVVSELVDLLLASKRVLFIGDTHELEVFYTLQLNLLLLDIPAIMYNILGTDARKIRFGEQDCVMFLAVHNPWFGTRMAELACIARAQGARTVILQQDAWEWDAMDVVLQYGIPGEQNFGYFSLLLIDQMLCDFATDRTKRYFPDSVSPRFVTD